MTYAKDKTPTAQDITVRLGSHDDVEFLARMEHEASRPPFEESIWDGLLKPLDTNPLDFLQAVFEENGSNWGNPKDFIILEVGGTPVACCAVFRPREGDDPASKGPLNLDCLPAIANRLGWSDSTTQAFKAAYQKPWGSDTSFMKPQAEVIVETVAVGSEFRGLGLGHRLMQEAFNRGRQMGAQSIGIMVIKGNDAAQALYEQHFEPYATFHGAYFNHEFPGLTKYRAMLTGERQAPSAQSS